MLDPTVSAKTVARLNEMARKGVDVDYGRGNNAYDRFFGQSIVKPNPTLDPSGNAPFYTLKLYSGYLGTKGGLLVDEYGQFREMEVKTSQNLYGTDNTTTSVIGNWYFGPGLTHRPAPTIAFMWLIKWRVKYGTIV